jgi:cytochrome c-type biogenesis protein CcmE
MIITTCMIIAGMTVAATLALTTFRENLLYFYSPSPVYAGAAPAHRAFRIGGLVKHKSVARDPDTLIVKFVLTDTLKEITVNYDGILPDLFREGQGIVANGRMNSTGEFVAFEVLAKHDENYMPPEVAEALQAAGKPVPATTLIETK